MKVRIYQIAFFIILSTTLFSLWAGFALLVVNKLYYKNMPGYVIGRLCIWELLAIFIAAAIAYLMTKKWGSVKLRTIEGKTNLYLDLRFGIYFLVYFSIAIIVAIWQFYVFSQSFTY